MTALNEKSIANTSTMNAGGSADTSCELSLPTVVGMLSDGIRICPAYGHIADCGRRCASRF